MSHAETRSFFFTDVLYIPSIYEDVFVQGFKFSGWALTPAPYFFPDMLIYFTVRAITGNFVSAVFLSGVVQYLLIFILFISWFSAIFNKSLEEIFYPALAPFSVISVMIYFFQPLYVLYLLSIHSGTLILFFAGLLLLASAEIDTKKTALILFFLSIAVLSDRMFLLVFVLPFVITYILFKILLIRNPMNKYSLKLLIIGSFIGLALLGILKSFMHVSLPAKIAFEDSIKIFFQNMNEFTIDLAGKIVFLFLSLSIILTIWLILVLTDKLKKTEFMTQFSDALTDYPVKLLLFYSIFSVVAIFCTIIAPVITGVYMDKYSIRYIIPAIVIALMNFSIFFLIELKSFRYSHLISIIIILFSFSVYTLLPKSANLHNKQKFAGIDFKKIQDRYPEEIACVDNLPKKYSLRFGLADYWNAKYYTLFSRKNLRVIQIDYFKLKPVHVLNNLNWYKKETADSSTPPKYNFIITDKLDKNLILKKFSQPDFIENCNSEIYIYKNSFYLDLN